jgi:hypothetical protein
VLWGGTRFAAVLAAAALLAGFLAACGEDGSTTRTDATTSPSAADNGAASRDDGSEAKEKGGSKAKNDEEPGDEGSKDKGAGGNGTGDSSGDSGPKVKAAPLQVSGGGSEQFRTRGGDNSIQDFGEEGDETELEEAAAALHGYMVARADEDWAAACSLLASGMAEQLEQLAASSEQLKDKGCPAILAALTAPLPASAKRETTVIDARSLRFDGERAFLLYGGSSNTDYFIPMAQEDGAWKVAGLAPTPLN